MATVSGVWRFNKTISFNTKINETVNFTCGNASFVRIAYKYESSSYYGMVGFETTTSGATMLYYGNSSKGFNGHLSGGGSANFGESAQTVSDDFYEWLTLNATKEMSATTFDLFPLNLTGKHNITVKARGTGYIASPASEAVEYTV